MFWKSSVTPIFFLALTASVNAHAAVAPALGVQGTPVRGDVQRPSTAKPCGKINIGQNLDSSTAVPADANGTFSVTALNFNPGADGSRAIKSVLVDASGTGKNFVAATMVVNGDPAPKDNSPQQLTVALPAGTTCTGGTGKDLCLASFTTTHKFGNCVVVSQGSGATNQTSSNATSAQVVNLIRSGAAKGMKRADPQDANPQGADQQDPSKSAKSGKDSKNAGKKNNKNNNKADSNDKKAGNGKKGANDNAKKGDKNKKGAKKADNDKKAGNAKNGGNAKKADKAKNGAKDKNTAGQDNTNTRRMTPRRYWSSRLLKDIADRDEAESRN